MNNRKARMDTITPPSGLFYNFAATAEQVAATSSRLAKAALLRDYLAGLADDELAIAARFFTGRPFAQADARVLNVGYALVRDVVCDLSGLDAVSFGQLATAHGEAGAAAEVALAGRVAAAPALTLAGVRDAYAALAGARGPTQKRPLLTELLRAATPLEAKYLLKLALGGDLRIGLLEAQLEDALARSTGVGVREVQWANMLLGDAGETALLARHGRLGEARMRLFHPLKFMLASPIQEPSEIRRSIAGEFFVEDKYDGIRGQVHVAGGRVAIFSRTLDEITGRFPELHAALLALGGDAILDGEILAARDGRILPFKELQQRLGRKTAADDLQARIPVVFVAYDLLYQDGAVLLELPLAERRARLEALLAGPGDNETKRQAGSAAGENATASLPPLLPVSVSWMQRTDDVAEIDPLFDAARARGNEGLVIKDPASRYVPGRRGREWLKVKKAYATLDVVVTAAEVGHGGRRHVLSDYTFAVRASADDPTLLNVGKAYSGLTDAEIKQLTEWFRAHTIQDFGRVRLVEPRVVLEVAFDIVQPSRRHKSGFALRFPRIVRIRDDKTPDQIDTLETVRRLAEAGGAAPDDA
jgi:DNA ligase-1